LDIRDSIAFEKANPNNSKTVREVVEAFWAVDLPISQAKLALRNRQILALLKS
jgi:hypothetical protein